MFSFQLRPGGRGTLDVLQKLRFLDTSDEFHTLVDHRLGYASNRVSLSKMRKLGHFDYICNDVFVFNRHFVSQPGHRWTVASSRGYKDLDVKILVQRLQRFERELRQVAPAPGNIEKAS